MKGDCSRYLSSPPRPSLPSLSNTDDEDGKQTQRFVWKWRAGDGVFSVVWEGMWLVFTCSPSSLPLDDGNGVSWEASLARTV